MEVNGYPIEPGADLRGADLTRANLTSVYVVSGRLGHSKPSTTLDVYSHFLPTADRAAAADVVGFSLQAAIGETEPRNTQQQCALWGSNPVTLLTNPSAISISRPYTTQCAHNAHTMRTVWRFVTAMTPPPTLCPCLFFRR